MADQRIADSGAGDDDVARLVALTERQHQLWDLLRDAKSDSVRNDLLDELTANREELARLKESAAGSHVQLPGPRPPGPVPRAPGPGPRPAEPEGPRSVGEQLRSRIMGPGPGVAPPEPPPPPPPPPILLEPSAVRDVEERVDLAPSQEAQEIVEVPADSTGRASPVDGGAIPGGVLPGSSEAEAPPEPDVLSVPEREVPSALEREVPSPPILETPLIPAQPETPERRSWQPDGGVTAGTNEDSPVLLPERQPYRSREDDIAVSRVRRDPTERRRPEPAPMRHTPEVLEELRQAAHETYREIDRVRPHLRSQPRSKLHPVLAILVAVAAVAAAVWFLFLYGQQGSDQVPRTTTTTTTTAPPQDAAPAMTEQIQAVIDDLGRGSVSVEESSGTIYLIGAVPTEADRQDVIGAAEALAGATPVNSTTLSVIYHDDDLRIAVLNAISAAGFDRLNATVTSGVATLSGVTPGDGAEDLAAAAGNVEGVTEVVDTTEKADRAPALAAQLERVTALTPILFEEGQVGLNESQEGILDDAADIIGAYAGPMVTITAYAANETVAADWAELARDRLTAQGVAAERLVVAAATERGSSGPESATGSGGHVEFEAGYAVAARGTPDFRIGIVAAGSRDDYATTQSIVDAALVIPIDRTDVGVDISDGIVTPTDAEFAIRGYARDGYDLVIVHGSEFGPFVQTIAADYPNVAFAWGGSDDTFDLPNVSAYQVAADQGGYVLGTLAAQLTENGVVGIVGSTDTGEDARYVDGFAAGIRAVDPQLTILTGYTGSTDDTALAEQTVAEYIASGADVLSASGGSTLGVLEAANQNDVPWFGNQADQARLAPGVVVASQVYHWEVALRQIVAGIDQGTLGGQTYTLDLANGGIVVDYSPYYPLAPELVTEAGNVTAGLIDGSTNTGV